MEQTLKNYAWAINLVVIAICAWLLAGLVASLFSYFLARTPAPVPAATVSTAPSLAHAPSAKEAILRRNLLNRTLSDPNESDLPAFVPGQQAVKTDLKIVLFGTIVTPDPQSSLATVQVEKDIKHYHVGELLDKKHPVQKIERGRVEFVNKSNGRLEYVGFAERQFTPPPARGPRGIASVGGEGGEFITKAGDNDFTIDAKEWEKSLSNINQIITQARAVPNMVGGGKVEGFRIFAIRPDSIYQKLGLVNGDVLLNVNGMEIDSINKALSVFENLKSERNFEIKVNRGGQPRSFKYEVR